ncbi:MAG: hypothetical protein AB7U66_02860 [Hyphomicrobiaceae bacterium]
MIRRILLFTLLGAGILLAGALLLGDRAGPQGAWARYQTALRADRFDTAATEVAQRTLDFEMRARRLALVADEATLLALPTIDCIAALGLRQAVYSGRMTIEALRAPASPQALHAAWRRSQPHAPFKDVALLAVLPLAPGRAVGWLGPRQYADDWMMLALAVAGGLRVDFFKENGAWRVDFMPGVRASAREHDAIGTTAPPGSDPGRRKRAFNIILAHGDAAMQARLWAPLDTPGRQGALSR